MATKKVNPLKLIEDLSREFVAGLEVTAEVLVEKVPSDAEPEYKVKVEGEDLGLMIGYHGETLNSLQLLLSLMVSQKLGEWTRITLDAGGWRDKRADDLEGMANRAAEQVLATGEEAALPIMSSSDRRIIHMVLSGNGDVTTESSGEEGYRRVVVKPRLP